MKPKYLLLAIVLALLAAGGMWFKRPQTGEIPFHSSAGSDVEMSGDKEKPDLRSNSASRLAPPDQTRRFREFTPEQRVEFARKGHGPGG